MQKKKAQQKREKEKAVTTKAKSPEKKGGPAHKQNFIEKLNADPSHENWKLAERSIKSSKAKYYKIFYQKGLKDMDSLDKAYAIIYDGSYKRLFRIPIVERDGKKMAGATKHLTGLKINTKY